MSGFYMGGGGGRGCPGIPPSPPQNNHQNELTLIVKHKIMIEIAKKCTKSRCFSSESLKFQHKNVHVRTLKIKIFAHFAHKIPPSKKKKKSCMKLCMYSFSASECVCVCVCVCVCLQLPSNQSFYRDTTGYGMSVGDHRVESDDERRSWANKSVT